MNLNQTLLLVPLLLLLIVVAVLWPSPSGTLASQGVHTLLHLNCPPGSHGKPRYTGVGQSLEKAREDARAARSFQSRAVTAQ